MAKKTKSRKEPKKPKKEKKVKANVVVDTPLDAALAANAHTVTESN